MKIKEMSLPSIQGFRPKPVIRTTHLENVIVVLTCWGEQTKAEKMVTHLLQALEAEPQKEEAPDPNFDPDATRVGLKVAKAETATAAIKKNLGETMAQALRKLNDFILTEVNQEKWLSAVEVTLIGNDQQYLYWTQVGQPQIFRSLDSGVEPLSYVPDMTLDFSQKIPLPFHALGLEKDLHMNTGMIPIGKTHQLILLSTPQIPGGLYISMGITLDSIVELIQQNFPDSPAWAGVIDFQI